MPKIRQLWELFVEEENSSYEKSSWCDLFLAQFVVELNDGKSVDEFLTFCNWSGVGTLIGCEFLSDINQVCLQSGDGEDLLRRHLYTRGWRALTVLLSLGQQNFSCSDELAVLLISLFPICLETKDRHVALSSTRTNNKYLRLSSETEVDSCFGKSPLKAKFSGVHGQLVPKSEHFRSHAGSNNGRCRRSYRGMDSARCNGDSPSSESENPCDDFNVITKSCALKIRLDPMDFDYFTRVVRSDDDARLDSVLYEPRRRPLQSKKIMPGDLMDDKIKDVIQSQVSPYEFGMLVVQFLTSLCRSEHSFNIATENSYPVCLKSVKFALENLCSIQFGSVSTQILESREAADLKASLTHLLVVSLDKVMGCPDVTTNVILSGILPMMLRVLEDSVCKMTSEINSGEKGEETKELYEKEKQQQVIFGLMCKAITFLLSFLMQNSDADRVRNFLELFKIFIESNSGKLIERTVFALMKFGNSFRAKKVIDLIGEFVSILKKVRKDMVNPHQCKRFKHKKCRNGDELHHHHDLFGAVFTSPVVGSNTQQNCCVSSLFSVLTKLLKKSDEVPNDIVNRTLRVMISCGTCCCFTTRSLLPSLSEIIKVSVHKTRVLVFQLLEKVVYPELGGYAVQTKGKITCVICSKQTCEDDFDDMQKIKSVEENLKKRIKDFHADKGTGSVKSEKSFPHQGDASFLEVAQFEKSTLRLDMFRELLTSADFRVVQGVTCHLLKCAPKMSRSAKHSILFNIFLPNFLSSKTQFFTEKDDVSAFRILSSLSVFSSLLNNLTFAEEFINQKGLGHVLDLISVPAFTRHCCSVLEKTIILAVLTLETDVSCVPSLATLRNAVDRANADFLKHFAPSEETFEAVIPNVPNAMGLKKKVVIEKKEEKSESKVIEVLENVCTFWKTYASLALYSPALRKYLSQECFLIECNNLLRIALACVTNKRPLAGKEKSSKSRDFEACLFTKLIESLLTFILATSNCDSTGYKENKILIEQLSESLLVNVLRNADVRRLTEVLLKCSLVQPSQTQIIPFDSTPKLLIAPLWSSCGDVSEVDENEERLMSDPESVEDNYVTADEGYEADVEIRDCSTTGEAIELNSLCSASESITYLSSHENESEKFDQKNCHLIVYPKLCLLAIDLLIKLYQEKSVERHDKSTEMRKLKHLRSKSVKKFSGEKQEHKARESQNMSRVGFEKLACVEETKVQSENRFLDGEGKYLIGLISIFQRLVSLCRDKPQNCAVLCSNNVILKILQGFQSCIVEKNEKLSELQKAILDFFTVLAKHSITPEELAFYLGFFKYDNPPVNHLLSPLLALVSSHSAQPNYMLRFPVSVPHNFIHNSITDFGKTIHVQHKNEGIISAWSSSALSIPIGTEINWPVWSHGFSLSLWLKIDKSAVKVSFQNVKPKTPQKPLRKISKAESYVSACSTAHSVTSNDPFGNETKSLPPTQAKFIPLHDLLHVFSIGNDTLTLECWNVPETEMLIWRLTRIDPLKGYEMLVEKTTERSIPLSYWNHVAISVKDLMIRKKTVIEVCLIVNGGQEISIPLSFNGILVRRYRPSSLILGAQNSKVKGLFWVGSLMLFTSPVLTRERAVYLLGLGPNCTNLTDTQINSHSPNFTSVYGMKNLTSEINWEAILEAKQGIIREVQSHLLIIYSAENPHTFNVYPSGSGVSSSSLFAGLRPLASEMRGSQQSPVPLVPCIFASLDQKKYQGLVPSSIILGGSCTFLFLFARVVELTDDPDTQSKYLYLFLKLVQSDCYLFSQFLNNEHHNMLHKVFGAPKCRSGLYILKAILDACCDKPVIQNNGGKFQVIQKSDAIIVNSSLIMTILSFWNNWCESLQENEVLELFFSALLSLLQDEHPHREFNVAQLNRAQMVGGLLYFCKERLLYDDKKILKSKVCVSLVELVKSLMGAPPEFSHIVAVMDCLILLHPVNSTYITHIKSSFYILLSAGQTYCSQEKSQSKGKSMESDSPKQGPQFLDNWILNVNLNNQIKKLGKHNLTQTVDASKLNKALTNLQLKQYSMEMEKGEDSRNQHNGELDSNRYSDDLTFDSGIAGSCREQMENVEENSEIIVKAVDGSQQNLTSFFPTTFIGCDGTAKNYATVSDEEEKFTTEKERREIEWHDDCGAQCVISEGLLLLLRDIILVLPDNMAQQILNHVVKLETLLVMANHKDHRVRSAVVKVFSSYLQRASDEDVNKFIKLRGFYHLANQISLFPASQGLVEDCLQLLTRCSVSLEQHNFLAQHELTYFGTACLPLLTGLLPRSVHDLSLAHNLITIIRLIYLKDESTSRALLENGLLEALVKTLVASAHFSSDTAEGSHQDLILLDVLQFFLIIVNQVLNAAGFTNMQIVSDLRLELHYVYRLEKENCGVKSRCVRVIRDNLCKILEKGMDILHNKIIRLQSLQKPRASILSVLNGTQQEQTDWGPTSNSHNCVNGFSTTSNNHCAAKELSRSELSERFKILIVNAVEFLIYSETTDGRHPLLSQTELNFIYHLFPLLLQILSFTLEKRSLSRRQLYGGIYWSIRDVLKTQTSELLIWLLSPRQTVKTRMFAITTLMSQSNCRSLLLLLMQTLHQNEQKFTVYLWDLMYNNKLASTDLRSCQELKESIQQWGVIAPLAIGNSNDCWGESCNMLISESEKQVGVWEKQMEAATMKCITKHDAIVKGMSEDALTMTRLVVDEQNTERKCFMEEMKLKCSETVQITVKWNALINNLTHERAVWFFERCNPVFWQLDPTEGPARVRKRLSRCHLGIDEKYFIPSQRHKLINERHPKPLAFLFEENKKSCTSVVLIERLHCNEKVRAMFSANIITPEAEIPGELLIGETCIYFVADDGHKLDVANAWPFEDVKEIHDRRYALQERAIEIFLLSGRTYFIAFDTSKERDALIAELAECDLPNRISGDNLCDLMQLWREGLITNWEYLTHLNKLAGRSYNDLMQYPVYPFVLSDYTSPTLDLTNDAVYRNFKKPMAVQEKKNEEHYINNYNELLGGLKQVTLNKEPYHYGSHYSNSGTVLHFLVRLPPFTKMLLQYQDRNFDLPDRTFHSMHTTWRLASSESTTDVKEMLPEFFFLPEFLINSQGFNFGVRQNGEIVDDVLLPLWSRCDARRFILIHRQALESDYVTENLPHWIDLVFGYKQTGKAAVDAINVFHPATYCGFDVESISDPVERIAWETMVKTYGQTPKQLLKTQHPFVIQSLICDQPSRPSGEVKGLKWGSYVGSPAEAEPVLVWRQQCKGKGIVSTLVPLITNDVLGLPSFTTSILQYNKEKGYGLVSSTGIRVALISWGYTDGIVRLKIKKELPLIPLVYVSHLDPVTLCVSEPSCNRLWIGHSSGNVTVYKFKFVPDRESIEFSNLPVNLQGHTKPITQIVLNRAFSVAVSASQDGLVIIWDLNNISYVRSLDLHSGPVRFLAVSDTLGDLAIVSQPFDKTETGNVLHLYSINASFIASVTLREQITSLCFSTAPEGVSINVIACGLHNGTIRLFSTWDLSFVRDISSTSLTHSVMSLAYSYDSQLLYASFRDGTVVAWESSGSKYGIKTPKFLNLKLQ